MIVYKKKKKKNKSGNVIKCLPYLKNPYKSIRIYKRKFENVASFGAFRKANCQAWSQ